MQTQAKTQNTKVSKPTENVQATALLNAIDAATTSNQARLAETGKIFTGMPGTTVTGIILSVWPEIGPESKYMDLAVLRCSSGATQNLRLYCNANGIMQALKKLIRANQNGLQNVVIAARFRQGNKYALVDDLWQVTPEEAKTLLADKTAAEAAVSDIKEMIEA
jgi:hypothetical protein